MSDPQGPSRPAWLQTSLDEVNREEGPLARAPGPTPPPPPKAHYLATNEQTKLTATALNNAAVAFGVAGLIAPLSAWVFSPALAPSASADVTIVASVVWIVVALALHMCGRLVLRGLRE